MTPQIISAPAATKQPPALTFGGLLRANAARVGDRPAIVFEGATQSWNELDAVVDRYARALLAYDVCRGSMIAVHSANRPEWLFLAMGCARIGATLAPLNTFHRDAEIGQQMAHSEPELLFVVDGVRRNEYTSMWLRLLPELAGGAAQRFARFPSLRGVIQLRGEALAGVPTLDAWLQGGDSITAADFALAQAAVQPTDDLYILYTSGSTGLPKGVRMAQGDCIANDFNLGERQGLTEFDSTWIATPMFYGLATINAIPAIWSHGGGIVLEEIFEAGESLKTIERDRPTTYVSLANMTRALYQHPDRPRRDISSLKKGIAGFSTDDLRMAIEGLGITHCCAMYGLTETYGNCFITDWRDSLEVRTTSQGKLLEDWSYRIVDDEGRPTAAGELGLLEVKGHVTPGYLRNEEANAQAFTADGFFITGDLVSVNEEGRLRFHSRMKEILKVGGVNVSPAEVEYVIDLHPDVVECHVVGLPDATKGEVVAAFVDPGGSALTEEAVKSFVSANAARFKVPYHVFLRRSDELPRVASGKVPKYQLREYALKILAEQGAQR
jgi:fatty-acyl-CoA synthase